MPRTKAKIVACLFIFGLLVGFELILTSWSVENYNKYYILYSVWVPTQFAVLILSPMLLIYRVITDKRSSGNLWERIVRDVLLKLNFMLPYLPLLGCVVAWIVIRTIPPLSNKNQRLQSSFIVIRQFFFHMTYLMNCLVLHAFRQAVEILKNRPNAPQKIPIRTFTAPGVTYRSLTD
jgi:hypothetical protein